MGMNMTVYTHTGLLWTITCCISQNRVDMNGVVVMMQVCEIPKNCLSGECIRYKNVRNWKQVLYIHWDLHALWSLCHSCAFCSHIILIKIHL